MLLLLLETKFGTVSPEVRPRVEAMSPEELRQTMIGYVKVQSLKELGLGGGQQAPPGEA